MRKKAIKKTIDLGASRGKLNAIPPGKGLTIAIDIDGTIADSREIDYSKADRNPLELMKAKPIPEARRVIRRLYKAGHQIVFHSSRPECRRKVTAAWLKKHGFPYHHLEMQKFVAHVYIDDRAINGCDWKQIVKKMKDARLPGNLAKKRGRV